jgi:heme/copper-type cytochrome/quinol oxidase subunit 3
MLKQSLQFASSRREQHQAKWFFYVFVASLGMFFAATLIVYLQIRSNSFRPLSEAVPGTAMAQGPGFYLPLQIPNAFWLSTTLLLVNSWVLQRALSNVRFERQAQFRQFLLLGWWSCLAFLVTQSVGMSNLWEQHFAATDGSTKVFGMSFVLSFVHALHVIGGMIFLGFILFFAFRGRYDHERHWPVDFCVGYWHFLGLVWIAMLLTFYLSRG